MTNTELNQKVLDYTRNAMIDNGFTCYNCQYGQEYDHGDNECTIRCINEKWAGNAQGYDVLKHSCDYCSDFLIDGPEDE